MSDIEITLTQAIFGVGNQNHAHVHRHNELHINSMGIDQLKMEQFQGGVVSASTLNDIAAMSGGVSTQPQGYVTMEDGFNHRRGIGLLRFIVGQNALLSTEVSVVGYLTGGHASAEGIAPESRFVPVRTWSTLSKSVSDPHGFPVNKTVIESSSQFLMGDPNQVKSLKSMRPLDLGNEALGYLACENEGREDSFMGNLVSDLDNSIVVSKTQNLNPTHFSRELLRLATTAGTNGSHGQLEMTLADGLSGQGIGEMGITENPFFRTMMFATGGYSMNGFEGYSIGEIAGVFSNFADVLNLNSLQTNNFAADDTLLTSEEYGSARMHEIIATELAFITVHLLLQTGLASFHFSATNNPMDFNGLTGNDEGVVVIPGPAMSVLDSDNAPEQRVEHFMELLKTHFFRKYSSTHAHMRTIMNIEVDAHMFGETVVAICFNGDHGDVKQYTNATYCINRTSTNIAGSDIGLSQAKAFLGNIRDHFTI